MSIGEIGVAVDKEFNVSQSKGLHRIGEFKYVCQQLYVIVLELYKITSLLVSYRVSHMFWAAYKKCD